LKAVGCRHLQVVLLQFDSAARSALKKSRSSTSPAADKLVAELPASTPSSNSIKPAYPYRLALKVLETEPEARAQFESPLHLERLSLPDKTKAFVRVLKNPHTGGVVYLIGTAHVSKAARDDVKLLIEAVEPDVVAVEVSIHIEALVVGI
jgi:hypothetical protein